MPGTYRIELSPNRRAGCQNKECKDAAIKIQIGELRFGVFVTIQEHQSWRWKHWGCVTPQQLFNLKDSVEDDLDGNLDGYSELDDFNKSKIAKAFEEGHVADDDWRGDVEVNRPGQKGFRTPASKKKAREEARAQQAAENGDDSPSKAAAKKKRGRAKQEDSEDEPPLKKVKAETKKGKKVKVEDDLDDELPREKVKVETRKGKKAKIEDDDDEPQPQKGRKKGSKPSMKEETDHGVKLEDHDEDTAGPMTKKRGSARKPKVQKIKAEDIDEDNSQALKASTPDVNGDDDEDEVEVEIPKTKRGRKPKAKKGENGTEAVPKKAGKSKQKETPVTEQPIRSTRSSGRASRSSAA